MISNRHREILVYAHWQGMENPVLMGTLHATLTRGNENIFF